MKVRVESIFDAFDYVMEHYYPYGLEQWAVNSDTYVVISIQDTHTDGFGVTFSVNKFCKSVLTLYFDDIERELENAVAFTEDMAMDIIRFIQDHQDVDTLLVHCYAGQSRSRAVGAFAQKMLGMDNSIYFKEHHPNMYVYNILEKVYTSL